MCLYTLPKTSLSPCIEALIEHYRLAGPTSRSEHYIFEELTDPSQLSLDYTTTILPPKKFLLPPKETLFQFTKDGQGTKLTPVEDTHATVIFGVHACDLHAIQLIDRFFEQDHPDQAYRCRRAATTIVSIECLQPCSQFSFCKSMGTDSINEEFDLHLTDIGDSYVCEVGSIKGAVLIDDCQDARPIKEDEIIEMNKIIGKRWIDFPDKLEPTIDSLPSIMSLSYESHLWQELGERCLACGACNIVCPTCYCFDVADSIDFDLQHGERYRIWDSCQTDGFAVVADGHNFRKERSERIRHRFMHKGKYQFEMLGLIGCVGCGRCAQSCLADISPLDVFNRLHRDLLPSAAVNEEVEG